jgi:hypothetical protein
LVATLALAQDFPGFQGGSGKQGRSTGAAAVVNNSGPGRALIRWFYPSSTSGQTIIRNNTSVAAGVITRAGVWNRPASTEEANNPYSPASTGNAIEDALIGTAYDPDNPIVGNRASAYEYAYTQRSVAGGSDPTVVPGGDPAPATMTFTVTPPDTVQRNYSLFVWLPSGPTRLASGRVFQARRMVVEVLYGTGQRYVDVVDTYASGDGWVRLGGLGQSTNRVFGYDGTNPIQIRIYNTILVDAQGNPVDGRAAGTEVVYADAVMAVPQGSSSTLVGSYAAGATVSQITPPGPVPTIRTVAAINQQFPGSRDGDDVTITRGTVVSYDYTSGAEQWRFSPIDVSSATTIQDNLSAGVTNNGFASSTSGRFQGTDFLSAALSPPAIAANVTYAPTLEDGEYEIQMFLGGDQLPSQFLTRARVRIEEGAAQEWVEVDMSQGPGWVTIGNRRYAHRPAVGEPLRVVVTNTSNDAVADTGRDAFADSIRYVGSVNLALNSTPIQARVNIRTNGGVIEERPVVIVPAEDGRIYCVDATGNGAGTTTVYWVYPSVPPADPSGWTDPNISEGIDGTGGTLIAEMPNGFDRTSALIERIGSEDFLFIGSRNGRVYKIELAGRGDYDPVNNRPGTTRRRWSFPDDFPGTRRTSQLGRFYGSVSFGVNADGPTLFVPASQGRIYALDATDPDLAGRDTDTRWVFPTLNSPTLNEIRTTPVADFNRVFFGTMASDTIPGQFYALNWDTGAPIWTFAGTAVQPTSDFLGAAATASSAIMGGGPDVVFVANENQFVYALEASTALPNVIWQTNELRTGVDAPLTYVPMAVRDNAGNFTTPRPTLMVPTRKGTFSALYGLVGDTNLSGSRLARQWQSQSVAGIPSAIESGVGVGRGFMYGTDQGGGLRAWNETGGTFAPGDDVPGEDVTENDPRGNRYRSARIKLINRAGYERLRRAPGDATLLTRTEALSSTYDIDPPRNPLAFDWGETVYLLVYDFPYEDQDPSGDVVPPPVVNFNVNTQGSGSRQIPVESRLFRLAVAGADNSGYAVLAFTIQGAGGNGLVPGPGSISATISSTALDDSGNQQNVLLPPDRILNFIVANPLAIAMAFTSTGSPDVLRSMGYTNNPSDPQNVVNGSPDVNGIAGNTESRLGTSLGTVFHGQGGNVSIGVADRSLMTLIRGPGRGVDQVRVSRSELEWMGGAAAVLRQIDPLLFPAFEDLPIRFPNDSLDYPNIKQDRVTVTKEPNGEAENPLFNGVDLRAPVGPGASLDPDVNPVTEDNFATRRILNTEFLFTVNVPRFQPANANQLMLDSAGSSLPAGYAGRFTVFVDTTNTGWVEGGPGRREAFRGFNLASAVAPDVRLSVSTPTVDLGSLAGGTGYTVTNSPVPYNPWASPWDTQAFKTFELLNEGNVNLIDLRLAKATNNASGPPQSNPWSLFAPGNETASWLDGSINLWSDIDTRFAPTARVILQKPRVGDEGPTSLSPNPIRRENPNINAIGGPLLDTSLYPIGRPKVGVTIPIGFPVGNYSQQMRVIEDIFQTGIEGQSLRVAANGEGLEPYSDPGFDLKFTVRETRLTNSYTRLTSPMVDDLIPTGVTPPAFTWQNTQPALVRDGRGQVLTAWASNRDSFTSAMSNANESSRAWRVYFSNLAGTDPNAGSGNLGGSPLRDLNSFSAANANQWFNQLRGPYPFADALSSAAQVNALFGASGTADDHVIGTQPGQVDTVRVGAPVFPAAGFLDPFDSNNPFDEMFVAMVAEAQRQTSTGRVTESRILVARVSASGGSFTISDPVAMPYDPEMVKGRPAIVQTESGALILYTGIANGQAQIFSTFFDSANFSTPQALRLGGGFESLGGVSASARLYTGTDSSLNNGRDRFAEISFTGKLRSRPVNEIFFARISLQASGRAAGSALLSPRTLERLEQDREPGVFRARGLFWTNSLTPILYQRDAAGNDVNLLSGALTLQPETGIMSAPTALGGQVYLDTNAGTVRFAGGTPRTDVQLLLSYQPRILRVSEGVSGGYSASTVLFDNRVISDASYWANPTNTSTSLTTQIGGDYARSGRYMFTYSRAAAGGGQTARPFMNTMRLGVQLPTSIHTGPGGTITGITVTGATGFYQVDPAAGRVYFTPRDEDRVVSIAFTGVDPANGQPFTIASTSYRIGLVTERAETQIAIEQAINEGSLSAYLDPFESITATTRRRPGVVWLIYASTRAGSPDVYLQSIAPRFTPVPAGQ